MKSFKRAIYKLTEEEKGIRILPKPDKARVKRLIHFYKLSDIDCGSYVPNTGTNFYSSTGFDPAIGSTLYTDGQLLNIAQAGYYLELMDDPQEIDIIYYFNGETIVDTYSCDML